MSYRNRADTGIQILFLFLANLLLSIGCVGLGQSIGSKEAKQQVRIDAEKAGVGEFYLDDKQAIKFRWKTATPEKAPQP